MADTKTAVPEPASAPAPETKKPHGNKNRKPSEKQMESLRKGMALLKERRAELQKKKDELNAKAQRGEVITPEEEMACNFRRKPKVVKVKQEPPKIYEPRKERRKVVGQDEFLSFRDEIVKLIVSQPERVVEKPVETERIVEKIVEKPVERILSGSELLNRVFFNK